MGSRNKVEVRWIRVEKPEIPSGTPYQDAYKHGIVENPFRNSKLCKCASEFVNDGKSVVFMVKEIEHGLILDKMLWTFRQKEFLPHQFINGKESSEIRNKAIADFQNGNLPIMIATSILDEGVDIPNIDVLIPAGGGKSSIKTLQRVGRGLRKGGTSDKLIVIDTADFQNEYLLKHSFQRMKDYKAEDCFELTVEGF